VALPHATYFLTRHVMNVEIARIYSIYKSSARLTPAFIRDLRTGYTDTYL